RLPHFGGLQCRVGPSSLPSSPSPPWWPAFWCSAAPIWGIDGAGGDRGGRRRTVFPAAVDADALSLAQGQARSARARLRGDFLPAARHRRDQLFAAVLWLGDRR